MDIVANPFTVRFLEQTVSITATNPPLTKAIQTHFAHCGKTEKSSTNPDFQITQHADSWQLANRETTLFSSKNAVDLLPHLMEHVLSQLISPIESHLILHAAGVSYQDKAILLCGASGSGKSTLALQLLVSGFDYLSDELIALPDTVDALYGFPRSLVLKTGSASLWQEQIDPKHANVLTFANGTSWLNPTLFPQSNIVNKAQPKLLLFPTYAPNSPYTITPITAGKASFNLLTQVPNARNLPNHGLRLVEKLAATVPAYEVAYANSEPVIAWLSEQVHRA